MCVTVRSQPTKNLNLFFMITSIFLFSACIASLCAIEFEYLLYLKFLLTIFEYLNIYFTYNSTSSIRLK